MEDGHMLGLCELTGRFATTSTGQRISLIFSPSITSIAAALYILASEHDTIRLENGV
jgi:hypothetical protein